MANKSTLIEMVGYDGKPIFIARDKIMAISAADDHKYGAPATTVIMTCGEASEEWIVHESVESIRAKYDK